MGKGSRTGKRVGTPKRRISLALSGGGACGFAHVGVIQTLERAGYEIVEVAGTSMGAVVAAYYALHGEVDTVASFARGLDRKRFLGFLDPTFPARSLLKGDKFRQLLRRWFGTAKVQDARIPLAITVTRLRTGKSEIRRAGSLVDVLMASSTLPGLFPAQQLGDDYYVDGGIALFTPVSALRKRGTLKVGVELSLAMREPPRFDENGPHLADVLTLIYGMQLERSQREPEPEGTVMIRPDTGSFRNFLDFHRSGEYLRKGERAAKAALPRIRKAFSERRKAVKSATA